MTGRNATLFDEIEGERPGPRRAGRQRLAEIDAEEDVVGRATGRVDARAARPRDLEPGGSRLDREVRLVEVVEARLRVREVVDGGDRGRDVDAGLSGLDVVARLGGHGQVRSR